MATNTDIYRAARDELVDVMGDYDKAIETFSWPRLTGTFNWATDWFDDIARGNDRTALWIVEEDGSEQKVTFERWPIAPTASRHGCNSWASARATG